jgi:predicted Zn-dependent protease with MMP-like domain
MKQARLASLASETVAATQRRLPREILELARAVPVHLQARPDADLLAEGLEPDLLGLFTGSSYGAEASGGDPMPPQIHLFTANIWDYAERDEAAFRSEVRLTYLHELGHYLGWDEDQIAERGLD